MAKKGSKDLDKIVYPHKPDQLVGSENDGNGEDIQFSLFQKEPKNNSRMSSIEDAYEPRYKEYR
jgi:hypothetical protein